MPPTLPDLAAFLADALRVTPALPPDDPAGLWRPAADPARPIHRLGLALEPWPGIAAWTESERLDALWLHRPWRLSELAPTLPTAPGILAHHLAFDERLTTGLNPRLADALSFANAPAPFGEKDGRPLGMTGRLASATATWETFARRVGETFGGLDETPALTAIAHPRGPLGTIAVVGAMNDALIREAAARGVRAFVTGQWRQPAADAVRETGMGILAVGHARAERWGLRALAGLLRERWAGLEVRLAPV